MTTALGVTALGVRPLAGTFPRAKPSVTITEPTSGAVVSTATVTVSFTYTSPISRSQVQYRIQLRSEDGSTILFDTGNVTSAVSSSIAVNYLLSGGSNYQLWVQASDGYDWSAWATQGFSAELFDVSNYPDEPLVGSVYEIGINGQGYMLADGPELKVQRRQATLQPPRLATSETPFSESIERYSFVALTAPVEGAGQQYLNRSDSSGYKYWDSKGINPFENDCIMLMPGMLIRSANGASSSPYSKPVIANDRLFMYRGTSGWLTSRDSTDTSESTFTVTGMGVVSDMASDGYYWYACDGSNIYRNSTNADPGSAWSTLNAVSMVWAIDRLAIVYDDGAGNLCVSTLTNAGAEEVAGGRFKYPTIASIPSLTAGGGYLWFVVNKPNSSQVHFWNVGSADTYATSGLTLPAPQKISNIHYYLGNVFVHAVEAIAAGAGRRHYIYRCVPNDGYLTAEKIAEYEHETSTNEKVGMCGVGRFFYFGWEDMGDESGYGVIDLATGGYARGVELTALYTSGAIPHGVVWQGKPHFTTDAGYLFTASDTESAPSGWLKTSIADFGSGLVKIWDEVEAAFDPLQIGSSVSVDYSLDGGSSYNSAGDAADVAGQISAGWTLGVASRALGLRLNLGNTLPGEGSVELGPCVRMVQTKTHPLTISDQILVLPIDCSDRVTGLNGQVIPYTKRGMERLKELQGIVGTRVRLQDVDWPRTGVATIWEVVDVQGETYGYRESKTNTRIDSGVAVITLRRAT